MFETLQDFAVTTTHTTHPASSDHQSGPPSHPVLATTTHPGTFYLKRLQLQDRKNIVYIEEKEQRLIFIIAHSHSFVLNLMMMMMIPSTLAHVL